MGDAPLFTRRLLVAAAAGGFVRKPGRAQAKHRLIAIVHPGAPGALVAEHIDAFRADEVI